MHKKNGNIIASILVALLCAGWAIVNSRTATTNKPPHFYGEAVGTTCSFECLSALRPAAAGEREVLAGEKSAVGGEFIASVEEVPCLGQAFEYFETNAPATFTSFRRLIYDEARGRYRIKWARGLGFPFQVRRNGEEYELLVDASLRSDRLQRVKIGGFGLEDAFALHQILSFGMAVRHAFLIDQGFCADAAAIDIETAKVISARAWLIKHERFDGAWKAVFCGDAARKGLAPLLDELCGEECPGKYTILYQELFRDDNGSADDVSIRGTSEGERKTARIAQAVVRIESSVGGTVDSQEALRLFDVINPIDGKELARKICDGRVSSEAQRNAWPDRWLYQEEEMALFKEREREMTLFELGMTIVGDHDVGNAIYYMHINAGIAAVIKKYPWMREGGRSHRALHYASRCMVYPISRFDRTRGGRFISFYTAWINKPRAAEMREEISDRQRILEALFTWGAKVEAKRIPDEHITDLADYRNVGPVAALLSGAKIGEARRMIAVLPARLRTVMKLVSGIRLGMPNVTPMKLEQVGEILGITFQRVEQLQKVALTRLEEETGQKPDREVPLDDGDLYLIARVGLSFDSPLFEELCARGEAWIEDHAAGLTAALCGVQPLPRPVITDDAAAWLSLSRELNRSRRDRDTAARSMARRRLYDDVAGDMQRYNALCALVSRFIREPGMDREAQRALTERICALGPVRAPVEKKRRWEAKSQRKRRIKRGGGRGFGESSVWISTPGSPEWVVRDVDLPEEVVVIPSMADGRLQVRIADGRSRFAPTYYEGSWHPESGTATTRAQEVAAYLAGTTGVQESPDGLISQRAVLGGTSAWLEVPMNGKVVPLYIDPALAIVPGEDGTPARRVFWRSRFQDVRGRGVRIALTPNGVPVGTAYVSGEELVPVPGPVLRSQRSYLGDAESGLILASRLRALECVKDAILVIQRPVFNRLDRNAALEQIIYPLGAYDAAGRGGEVAVTMAPTQQECFVKFIPYDRAFEVYTEQACTPGSRVMRGYYRIAEDTFKVIDVTHDADERFRRAVSGEAVKPMVLQADGAGRIILAPGVSVDLLPYNKGKEFFVMYARSCETGQVRVSIYDFEKPRREGGLPAVHLRSLRIVGTSLVPSLETLSDRYYDLAGVDRLIIQEWSHALGYTPAPKRLSPLERGSSSAILDGIGVRKAPGRQRLQRRGTVFIHEAV